MGRILVATAVLLLIGTATARACSCVAPGDPRAELQRADAALFGTVVAYDGPKDEFGPGPVDLTIRVERDYKDNLPDEVVVRTNAHSASCGLGARKGDEVGALLSRYEGRWTTSSCAARSRQHLEAGLEDLPPPDGVAPARLFVGGAFGSVRSASLDGSGRVIGYGAGSDVVTDVAACGETVLELVGRRVVTRRVDGLGIVRRTRVGRRAFDVECVDGKPATLLRGGRLRLPGGAVVAAPGIHLLAQGRGYGRRRDVDLRTGEISRVRRPGTPLALSPQGRLVTNADVRGPRAVFVTGDVLAAGGPDRIRLYDRDLEVIARLPGGVFTVTGGQLVVIDDGYARFYEPDGALVARTRLFSDFVYSCVGL